MYKSQKSQDKDFMFRSNKLLGSSLYAFPELNSRLILWLELVDDLGTEVKTGWPRTE